MSSFSESIWEQGKLQKTSQALWNTMSNYANDNGTGLEQQVNIILDHPVRFFAIKSVNENFFTESAIVRAKKKSNMAAQHRQ